VLVCSFVCIINTWGGRNGGLQSESSIYFDAALLEKIPLVIPQKSLFLLMKMECVRDAHQKLIAHFF
jgi:hypothetical protein